MVIDTESASYRCTHIWIHCRSCDCQRMPLPSDGSGKVVASRIDTDYRLFPRKEKHFHLSRKEKVSEIWKLVDLIPHRRPIPPSTTKIQLLSCSRNGNRRDYRHPMEEVESFQPASGRDIFFFCVAKSATVSITKFVPH